MNPDVKHGLPQATGRQSLAERLHQNRARQIQQHRRQFGFDKRVSFIRQNSDKVVIKVLWSDPVVAVL